MNQSQFNEVKLIASEGWIDESSACNDVLVVRGNLAAGRRGVFFECVIDKVT
jgi:hypothetical protein